MKSAHGLVRGRHPASYGSQARFIADLSDPDASWFVLLGGQDGRPAAELRRPDRDVARRARICGCR